MGHVIRAFHTLGRHAIDNAQDATTLLGLNDDHLRGVAQRLLRRGRKARRTTEPSAG